jgi:multicomponent Na+:H+ antiporter subunit D
MLVISTLFLVGGWLLRQRRTADLRVLGGVYRAQPLAACLALVPLFSLAGVPPLSGFIAKLAVVRPLLDQREYAVAAVALGVSLLTLLSMARVWEEAFWKPVPAAPAAATRQPPLAWSVLAPVALLVTLTAGMTVAAGPIYGVAVRAAEQLLDQDGYVRAVLGEEEPVAAR